MKFLYISLALLSLTVSTYTQAEPLKIYTYDSFVSEWGPGPKLEQAFEQQCGCDIEFFANEDGVSLLNRLRMEGRQTDADVILGLDNLILQRAIDDQLVDAHNIDLSGLATNLNWGSEWFVPFDRGYFAWIYDSEKIATPAKSFEELVSSDARIIYMDPRTSTPGFGLLTWINNLYPDNATAIWQQLADRTETVTAGWWEGYSLFLNGGADYVLSYSSSPAYHEIAEQTSRYKAAGFEAGHVAQVEVAAISRYSDQKELARTFLQFLISKEAQEILPVTNWMLPVIDHVELPDAFDRLVQVKDIAVDSEAVNNLREQWIKTWRSAVIN